MFCWCQHFQRSQCVIRLGFVSMKPMNLLSLITCLMHFFLSYDLMPQYFTLPPSSVPTEFLSSSSQSSFPELELLLPFSSSSDLTWSFGSCTLWFFLLEQWFLLPWYACNFSLLQTFALINLFFPHSLAPGAQSWLGGSNPGAWCNTSQGNWRHLYHICRILYWSNNRRLFVMIKPHHKPPKHQPKHKQASSVHKAKRTKLKSYY